MTPEQKKIYNREYRLRPKQIGLPIVVTDRNEIMRVLRKNPKSILWNKNINHWKDTEWRIFNLLMK